MLEGLLADDMLHPAGVLFRRFTVNTGSDELLCEELMAFIDYFRHFLAYVGQVEKSILIIFPTIHSSPARKLLTTQME